MLNSPTAVFSTRWLLALKNLERLIRYNKYGNQTIPPSMILMTSRVSDLKCQSREVEVQETITYETWIFLKSQLVIGRVTNNDLNLGAILTAPTPFRIGYDLSKNRSFLDQL